MTVTLHVGRPHLAAIRSPRPDRRWDDALAAASAEYLELAHRFMPEIIRSFHHDDDGVVRLHVEADGPLADMLQNHFADVLD